MPAAPSVGPAEALRACGGALLGILSTGLISAHFLGPGAAAFWLIAPMGASAVLLFAVPASPLAQPWSIVGGNLVAALAGVTCFRLIGAPVPAAAAAIFVAIAAMLALRCLHPPSGAVALTAVLGGAPVHALGYAFVIVPVAMNTVLLLTMALLYNNLTGRRYPHAQRPATKLRQTGSGGAPAVGGFIADDLQAVLHDYGQVVDIGADELEMLFRQTEMRAFARRFGERRCGDIMSKDAVTAEFATELDDAWRLMNERALEALPVTNQARHVIGVVTRSDFLRHADLHDYHTLGARLRAFLQRTAGMHSDKDEVVGQIMSAPARTARDDQPIAELVPLMSDAGLHHIPVVDAQRRLVGMVSQSRLVAALYEQGLSGAAVAPQLDAA